MADDQTADETGPTGPLANGADTSPSAGVISQYIKDLSFENPGAPQIYQNPIAPELDVQFNIGATQIGDDVHEVVLKIEVKAQVEGSTDRMPSSRRSTAGQPRSGATNRIRPTWRSSR